MGKQIKVLGSLNPNRPNFGEQDDRVLAGEGISTTITGRIAKDGIKVLIPETHGFLGQRDGET